MSNRLGCYKQLAPGDRVEYYSLNIYEVQDVSYEGGVLYASAVGVHCGGMASLVDRLVINSGELTSIKRIIKYRPKPANTHPTAELAIAP